MVDPRCLFVEFRGNGTRMMVGRCMSGGVAVANSVTINRRMFLFTDWYPFDVPGKSDAC